MNANEPERSEFLFVGSFKHVPREFVLCVTSNLVEEHSGPGGQLKQNADCRDRKDILHFYLNSYLV